MSRLLFAAARGARIETQYQYPKKKWGPVAAIRTDHFYLYRIHLDDMHLQYGPISTEMRRLAEFPPMVTGGLGDVWRHYVNVYKYSDELYMNATAFTQSLFLLILSEALADEGL